MKRTTLIQRCYLAASKAEAERMAMVSTAGTAGMPKQFRLGLIQLRQCFAFMGRTEFEGHALGRGLQPLFLSDPQDLALRELKIHPKQIEVDAHHGSTTLRGRLAPIFYLCLQEHAIQVHDRLRILARNDRTSNSDIRLIEPIYMSEMLKFDNTINGEMKPFETWMELDNGFIFTTSPTVAQFLGDYFNPSQVSTSSPST